MNDGTATKVCTKCGTEKSLPEFSPKASAKDGRRTACKRCAVEYATRYAEAVSAKPKPPPIGEKRCGICGETKPRTQFHVRRASSDGRSNRCKPCGITLRHAYRNDHPDKVSAAAKVWRDKNPGYSAASARAWRLENPDRVRENRERWARENADLLAATKAAWARANRERINAQRDPEITRRWRRLNPDAHREAQARRRAQKRATEVGPVDVAALWTGLCGICQGVIDAELSWPNPNSRSLDHIMPLAKGGGHTQDNLQWAHLRCNISKGARLPEQLQSEAG